MTYPLGDNDYTVEYFEAPGQPSPSRYSERPYGRFGAFYSTKIDEQNPLKMRYRLVSHRSETAVRRANSGPIRRVRERTEQLIPEMMPLDTLLSGNNADLYSIETSAPGPEGALPLSDDLLVESPSGDIFGMTQSAGMGWDPNQLLRDHVLILSTMGGIRAEDGSPIALGYHTGHWEVGLLMQAAARELDRLGKTPLRRVLLRPL